MRFVLAACAGRDVSINAGHPENRTLASRLAWGTPTASGTRMKPTRHTPKHREPSRASVKEIPEVDFAKARVRPNHHAARIAKDGITVQVGKGTPVRVLKAKWMKEPGFRAGYEALEAEFAVESNRIAARKLAATLKIPPGRAMEAVIKAKLLGAVHRRVARKKLTNATLAQRTGLAERTVTAILQGRAQRVSIKQVLRLVVATGLNAKVRAHASAAVKTRDKHVPTIRE